MPGISAHSSSLLASSKMSWFVYAFGRAMDHFHVSHQLLIMSRRIQTELALVDNYFLAMHVTQVDEKLPGVLREKRTVVARIVSFNFALRQVCV